MPEAADGMPPGAEARSRKRKPHARHALRLGRHRVSLPRSRPLRILLGSGLVLGGVFAFLPVLGLWMLPLGAAVLSIDVPPMRRLRRRTEVWWGRSGARDQASGVSNWVRVQLKKVWPRRWN